MPFALLCGCLSPGLDGLSGSTSSDGGGRDAGDLDAAADRVVGEGGPIGDGGTVVLASNRENPRAITVDAKNAYWIESNTAGVGSVVACAIGGCGGNPAPLGPVHHGNREPGLAADGTNVYWTNPADGTVVRCAVDGCNQTPAVLAIGQNSPTVLEVDATSAYWGFQGGVSKVALAGGPVTPLATFKILNSGATVVGFGINTTLLYAATWDTLLGGGIHSCTLPTCSSTQIAGDQVAQSGLTMRGANVVWADVGQSAIMKCPVANCAATMSKLAVTTALGANPTNVVVDATYAYWPEHAAGVKKCAVAGCGGSPQSITSAPADYLAVDGTTAYWIDHTFGTVTQAPK